MQGEGTPRPHLKHKIQMSNTQKMKLQFHNHRGTWPKWHIKFFEHVQGTYLLAFRPLELNTCGPGASKLHANRTKDMGKKNMATAMSHKFTPGHKRENPSMKMSCGIRGTCPRPCSWPQTSGVRNNQTKMAILNVSCFMVLHRSHRAP